MSSPRYVDRAAPAWVRALLTALFACAALYAVLLVGGGEALGLPLDPGSWLPIGVLNLCAACSCIGRAVYRPRERRAWALLGTGMLFSSSGFLLWAAVYEQQAAPPYPSLSDALWLPYYVFLLAAIVALLKAERPRIPATAWLDAVIPACAVSAIASQLLLPHVTTAGQPLGTQITLLAYPALDVVLVVGGRRVPRAEAVGAGHALGASRAGRARLGAGRHALDLSRRERHVSPGIGGRPAVRGRRGRGGARGLDAAHAPRHPPG
jgi:hypothetical protein